MDGGVEQEVVDHAAAVEDAHQLVAGSLDGAELLKLLHGELEAGDGRRDWGKRGDKGGGGRKKKLR